jgi:hypothetical protein
MTTMNSHIGRWLPHLSGRFCDSYSLLCNRLLGASISEKAPVGDFDSYMIACSVFSDCSNHVCRENCPGRDND